jgi:hypothetical protein
MTGGYPESQPPPFSTRPSGPSTTSRWQVLGRIEATRCLGGPDLLSSGFSGIYIDLWHTEIWYTVYIYVCVCVCVYIYMWYVFNHPFLRYEIFKILLTYYKSLIVSHFGAHHCHSSSSQVRMGEDVNINWQRARCAVMIRAFTKSSRDLNSK